MPSNSNPFMPWNGFDKNNPFAPWNHPMYERDPFAPWNNPFGDEKDLDDYCNERGLDYDS